jgi:hypothetical protein
LCKYTYSRIIGQEVPVNERYQVVRYMEKKHDKCTVRLPIARVVNHQPRY